LRLWPKDGAPYLSKTALLRRRLLRLLKEREKPSRLLNLRHTVARIEYWLTGSAFESAVVLYEQARRHFPDSYLDLLKPRMPPYLKSSSATNSRAATSPPTSPARAACISARSARALPRKIRIPVFRPLPTAPLPGRPVPFHCAPRLHLRRNGHVPAPVPVGGRPAEYAHEVARVVEFLRTDGRSLADAIAHSRDRLSETMQFEEAARQHKRLEKVEDVLKLRDDLARDVDRLNGVAITRSLAPFAVEMWFMRDGNWQQPQRFGFEVREGKPISLDHSLRETFAQVTPRKLGLRERQEYLALLAPLVLLKLARRRMAGLRRLRRHPYRKLVNAVSRVTHRDSGT